MPEGPRPSRMIVHTGLQTRRQGHVLARALLFVPALALLSFTLWRRADPPVRHGGLAEPTEPMKTGTVGLIDGWEGRVVRDAAAPLTLRLETLHPEQIRQAFDAEALRRELRGGGEAPSGETRWPVVGPVVGPADGAEPWRLTISVAAAPVNLRAAENGSGSKVVVPDLSAVRLVGLEPLVREAAQMGAPAAEGGPARDPLSTLLTFFHGPLHEGETCDLVFWGKAPEGSVRAVIPGVGEVELRAQSRSADSSTASIASLDGRQGTHGGGK
ncbi:MAG: hypothetical protein ACI8WY_001471 [Planctomycetota bacterium]|jgi:hypothetical protein